MKIKKGDSRSKSTKKKQGMTARPFPNNCGAGGGKGKAMDKETHQFGSKVKKKKI